MLLALIWTISLEVVKAVPLVQRSTELTGQWTCATGGNYTLCQNLWGESAGVGSQNSTLIEYDDLGISWSTSYTWEDGYYQVKSYADVQATAVKNVQLSSIKGLPTLWDWEYSYQSSDLRADVSYDMFLGTLGGEGASVNSSYEIMIWVGAAGGVGPLGSQVENDIEISGYSWNLFAGANQNWEVYSFVAAAGNITLFVADINDFFVYLEDNYAVAPTQYIQSIETGTEPFTGAATLLTKAFSVELVL